MTFSDLGIFPELISALAEVKITHPFPIQEKAIPAILARKDVLGIAQTGSGKTASYALPLLMKLRGKTTEKTREVNTLVLVPTRELAIQVSDVFNQLSQSLPYSVKTISVYGGVSINPQMKGMYGVNILVATPGRLLELIENKAVHISNVETLVLDEADKMLNLGFEEEMNRIFSKLPSLRQNLLFSATLSPEVSTVERVLLNNPTTIKIEAQESNLETITQTGYFVSGEKKGPLLRKLIQDHQMHQVLIFTSSTKEADKVSDKLYKNGISSRAIHSKKTQGNRKESLGLFKKGKLQALVATDLLSRGIDIEFLPFVINYELPRSPKDFIHRIGRTGRAENPGEAITFVTEDDKHHFKVIQKKMKRWVDMVDTADWDY
jgi:ATP-dependent RNA helicase RhlE